MTGPAVVPPASGQGRLVHLGNVVIDVVLTVPWLPERGGDVLASATTSTPGGGFNVMAAAARQGLPVAYAGARGTGPFAELAAAALAAEGIEVLQPPKPGLDTGVVISLVEAGGERTFVTGPGAEARLTAQDLARRTGRACRRCLPVRLRPAARQQPARPARLAGRAERGQPRLLRPRAAGGADPGVSPGRRGGPRRLADLQRARGRHPDRPPRRRPPQPGPSPGARP